MLERNLAHFCLFSTFTLGGALLATNGCGSSQAASDSQVTSNGGSAGAIATSSGGAAGLSVGDGNGGSAVMLNIAGDTQSMGDAPDAGKPA